MRSLKAIDSETRYTVKRLIDPACPLKSGFTLIELLIVVAIIGILAAIAVPNFLNARLRAQISRVESELKSVNDAYLMYNMDNQKWPPHIDGDIAQHRFVTTPIAYLSTSIEDPFQKEGTTDSRTLGWYKGQYHEEPGRQMIKEYFGTRDPASIRYGNQNIGAAYFARSVGPDMDAAMERTVPYDITNGLKSHGTLARALYASPTSGFPFYQGNRM